MEPTLLGSGEYMSLGQNTWYKEAKHPDFKGKLGTQPVASGPVQAGSATYMPDGKIVPTEVVDGPAMAKAIREKAQGKPVEPAFDFDADGIPF